MDATEVARVYRNTIRAARLRGLGLAREALTRVLLLVTQAGLRIDQQLTPFHDRPLTESETQGLRAQLDVILAQLMVQIAQVITTASDTTVTDVTQLHIAAIGELFGVAQVAIGGALAAVLLSGMAAKVRNVLLARRQAQTVLHLLQDDFGESGDALDSFLLAAAIHGVPPSVMVRDLRHLLTRSMPVDLKPYGLEPGALAGYTSLAFKARMLAATEPLNALREANTEGLIASPIVRAAHWNVSARHATLPSSPDECDILALGDFFGLGRGMYPPARWPRAPHPFCQCVQGPPFLFWPAAEWQQAHPVPAMTVKLDHLDLAQLAGGQFSPLRHARALRTIRESLFDTIGRRARSA